MMDGTYAVLGPLRSGVRSSTLGCEVVDGLPRSDLPVALVWLPQDAISEPKRFARLLRETALAQALDHPGILRLHGIVRFDEGWARVTDYADGEPLSDVLDFGQGDALPPELAARIVLEVAEATHSAHEAGLASPAARPLVHGGIRPDTVLLGFDGRAALGGFGASALAPATAHGTDRMAWAAFCAPEQILGGKSTSSVTTDVYALGALLLALLEGKWPFSDASDLDAAILTETPAPPAEPEADLASRLRGVAVKAMAKRGSERPPSVEAFADAVSAAFEAEKAEMPSEGEVSAWLETRVPPNAPNRARRAQLLELADDADAVTLLSLMAPEAEDVDPEIVKAALPRRRRARPREAETVIEPPPVSSPPESADPSRLDVQEGPHAETNNELPPFPGLAEALDPVVDAPTETPPPIEAEAPPPVDAPPAAAMAAEASVDIPPAEVAAPPAPQAPTGPWSGDLPPRPEAPYVPAPAPTPDLDVPGSMPPNLPPPPPGYAYAVPLQLDPRTGYPLIVPAAPPTPHPGASPYPASGAHAPMAPYPGSGHHVPMAPYPGSGHHTPMAPYPGSGHHVPMPGVGPYPGPSPQPAASSPSPAASAKGQSFLADAQSGDLLANQPVQGLPKPDPMAAGMDRESRITAFNRTAGDGSRSLLVLVVLAAFGLLAFVLFTPNDVPDGLDAPPEAKLDQKLVDEILTEAEATRARAEPSAEAEASPETRPEGTAESPPTEDAAAPEASQGQLQVKSEPNVDVYVDGERLGRTPMTVNLPSGRPTVRLTDRKTGINTYRKVRIDPDTPARIDEVFETGQLVVRAPDGARVFLNGRFLGTAPLDGPIRIYEGPSLLKVTFQGLRWSERFEAEPGRRISFDVTLDQP